MQIQSIPLFRLCQYLAMALLLLTGSSQAQQSPSQDDAGGNSDADEAPAKTTFPDQLPRQFGILQQMSARALVEDNLPEFVRILEHSRELFPYDPGVMIQLVAGYALQDEKTKAYNLMLNMQQQGIGFDFNQLPQSENIRATESYEYINGMLIANNEGIVSSETAFTLPQQAKLVEAITYDPKQGWFLFGSVREPDIFVLDGQGQPVKQAPDYGKHVSHAVFDMAVDNKRRQLWVSTSAVTQQLGYRSSDYGNNALLKIDLDSGELLHKYNIKPDGESHGMGNIAVADDGTVYLADLRSPAIYMLAPDDEELTVLAVGPSLPGIRGITLNEEQNLLYLADQRRGLAFIDLADKRSYLMGAAETLNLGGIEGVDYWNDHLIIIQPGMRPARAMKILLANNGRNTVTSEPVDANHPEFKAPNYGVVVDDEYYYLGASHWSSYDINGNRLPGTDLSPVPVLKFALQAIDPAQQFSPELEDILRRRAEQQKNQPPAMLRPAEEDDG